MYIQVAVARKLADSQDVLTYHVPESLQSQIRYGSMVHVPMGRGNQVVQGYVVDILSNAPEALSSSSYKDVLTVLESETLLNAELIELALWMSRYYLCPCYYVLEYMLPKFARTKKQEFAVWNGDSDLTAAQLLFLEPDAQALAETIRAAGELSLERLYKQHACAAQQLPQLVDAGLVHIAAVVTQQGSSKTETVYESCITPEQLEETKITLGRAVKQWEILRYLTYEGPTNGKTLRSYWSNYLPVIKELEKKQLVIGKKMQVQRFHDDNTVFRNTREIVLNTEQQSVLDTILKLVDSPRMECALLHGVTGSGKT